MWKSGQYIDMYQVLEVGKIHSFIINPFKLSVLIFFNFFAHHSKMYAICIKCIKTF